MYGIQQQVTNQRSRPCIDNGAEDIGNLNSSVHGEGRNLNVLCHWRVKCDDLSTCDAPYPGRPKTVTTLDIIDQIHELILEDCRISAKSITEQLGILCEWVGSIIHEDLEIHMSALR